MRKKRPIRRSEDRTRDASLVVIASEDRYAVKQYFEMFHSTRVQFHVLETDNGQSSPEHVMERLDQYMDEYSVGEGDQFWLVCDTDHWIESSHIQNLVEVVRVVDRKVFSSRYRTRVSTCGCCFISMNSQAFGHFPVVKSAK